MCRSPTCRIVSSRSETACCSRRSSTSAIAWTTSAGSLTPASSTSQTPSSCAPSWAAAASIASRVFPAPPGPVSVSARPPARSRSISRISRSRPTKLLSWTGRLCGRRPTARWAVAARLGSAGAAGAATSAVATAEPWPSCGLRSSGPPGSAGTAVGSRRTVPCPARAQGPCAAARTGGGPASADRGARTGASDRDGRPRRLDRARAACGATRQQPPDRRRVPAGRRGARGRRGSPDEGLARGLRPSGVPIIGQEFAAVEVTGGDGGRHLAGDRGLASRGGEGLCVDPQAPPSARSRGRPRAGPGLRCRRPSRPHRGRPEQRAMPGGSCSRRRPAGVLATAARSPARGGVGGPTSGRAASRARSPCASARPSLGPDDRRPRRRSLRADGSGDASLWDATRAVVSMSPPSWLHLGAGSAGGQRRLIDAGRSVPEVARRWDRASWH